MPIDFGYSPCPNDTFLFWAWVHGLISEAPPITPRFADIQELNLRALGETPWALTKVSASTYFRLEVQERYRLLSVGAALGRGCGPLVVSRKPWPRMPQGSLRLAVPGLDTTACRLARAALGSRVTDWIELRYDQIMPAVLQGRQVDAGVIIHESRFAYQSFGLHLALDLGQWWEEQTGLPLPLGVMVAHRSLELDPVARVEEALRQSLEMAWQVFAQPKDSPGNQSLWDYLRTHAIELEDSTIAAHIELYVNQHSLELGTEGRTALERLEQLC